MSDAAQEQQQEVKTFTAEEVESLIAEKTSGLENKVKELLGETKAERQKRREIEEAQKGEFKSLYEQEQKSKLELQEKYEGLTKSIQDKEVALVTNSLAAELTKDTSRANLLAQQVKQYAKYQDGQVVFEMGGMQVDKAKVVSHISESYPFLIDGSGATGGSSRGANAKGSAEKTVSRSDFDAMSQQQRGEFFKSGGKVTND